jgi:hypothetical protein
MPEIPFVPYTGRFEGGAVIVAPGGQVLAQHRGDAGSGVAVADVEIGRVAPTAAIPSRYWLHRRGLLPAIAWNTQRLHGRRWYRRHVRGASVQRTT